MSEWARGKQFLLDELQPACFVPFGERFAGMAGQRHQLPERPVVKAGILADVERGKVKAEGVHGADDRHHVARGDAPGAHLDERRVERFQIGRQFSGARVHLPGLGRIPGGQLEQQQAHVAFPRLLGRVVEDGLRTVARLVHETLQARRERCGRRLDVL